MPLNAFGWSSEEDEKLVELVAPHCYLYNALDPSRKNILARETTWQEIAQQLDKPVEECKKRWRGLRDGYMRAKRRMGTMHKTHKSKVGIFERLQFLEDTPLDCAEEMVVMDTSENQKSPDYETIGTEQQVITDNQEYYEITLVDGPQDPLKPFIKIVPNSETTTTQHVEVKKVIKRPGGRKKSTPIPRNIPPVKILPKPLLVGPKIVQYIEDTKVPEQRSETIDKLIEKILKENTNEIDVFFRSMAASVKKLQPNLIPKVKMEVCNVIAKYEMQSFDKTMNFVG